jgi:tetratricopeptide (TPR) repeat protein
MPANLNATDEARFQEALELDGAGKFAAAVTILKNLAADCEDPRVFAAYGFCLQHLKHWKESIPVFERALALKPHYCEGEARLMLADSLFEAGRKKEAIAQWRLVAKREPEYPSYERVPDEAKAMLAKYDA